MTDKIGAMVVCYGSRGVSMVDAFLRSSYDVELYIADKQKNPFNARVAKEHAIIPDLNVPDIVKFAKKFEDKIDLAIVCPEGPIIAGVRDEIESATDIPVVCPTKEFALEESKVQQRELLAGCCPDANPRFKVFRKSEYGSSVKGPLYAWLDEFDNQVAVKPDRPGYGKGVGVWGDHFQNREQLFAHFMGIYENDAVIIEEKIDGQESSYQCFCDGKRVVPMPDTRDYKRAFEEDKGPNTGGMGCYRDSGDILPFMTHADRKAEEKMVNKLFKKLRGEGTEPGLRGIPLYVAFMHSADGPKILEINSRGGDPESPTVISTIKDDFVELCFSMIEGKLRKVRFEDKAAVLIYKVPPAYGGFDKAYPDKVAAGEIGKPVDLSGAKALFKEYGHDVCIYPGSMELRGGNTYALGSRAVACIGKSDSIEEAREIALKATKATKGGGLWYREDIASKEHIAKSVAHMKRLRGAV